MTAAERPTEVTGSPAEPTGSTVSTHVLDSTTGTPAAGMDVRLEQLADLSGATVPMVIGAGTTDPDGRLGALAPEGVDPGTYRLVFATGSWFLGQQRPSFYPEVSLTFVIEEGRSHCHVPLLLAPFAYSTYRGS